MLGITKNVLKKVVGVFLVIFGFIALLIPFFPFAWVAFFGFELLGITTIFKSRKNNV